MVMAFSQADKRWGNMGLGLPFRRYGCYVSCLSMLLEKTPDNVLNLLMEKDCFDENGYLINAKAALVLGFKRYQKFPPGTNVKPPIIAETDFYVQAGVPQHFYLILPNGKIIDPLDGMTKNNPYNVVSFRLFS